MRKPTWIQIKEYYFDPQFMSDTPCWLCPLLNQSSEKPNKATQLHHGVINKGRFNSRKFHKYLNVIENAIPVCAYCNERGDSLEARKYSYALKERELGIDRMEKWYANFPAKVKDELK